MTRNKARTGSMALHSINSEQQIYVARGSAGTTSHPEEVLLQLPPGVIQL